VRIEDCKPGMKLWTHIGEGPSFEIEVIGTMGGDKVIFRRFDTGVLDDHVPSCLYPTLADDIEAKRSSAEYWGRHHREQAAKYAAVVAECTLEQQAMAAAEFEASVEACHPNTCMCIECIPTPVVITDDDDEEGEDTTIYETGGEAGYQEYAESFDDTDYGELPATPFMDIPLEELVA
jgi:hypothetical protein